jgi:hypothetical protein
MKLLSGKARQSRRQRALRLLEKQVERYRSRIEQLKDSKKHLNKNGAKLLTNVSALLSRKSTPWKNGLVFSIKPHKPTSGI